MLALSANVIESTVPMWIYIFMAQLIDWHFYLTLSIIKWIGYFSFVLAFFYEYLSIVFNLFMMQLYVSGIVWSEQNWLRRCPPSGYKMLSVVIRWSSHCFRILPRICAAAHHEWVVCLFVLYDQSCGRPWCGWDCNTMPALFFIASAWEHWHASTTEKSNENSYLYINSFSNGNWTLLVSDTLAVYYLQNEIWKNGRIFQFKFSIPFYRRGYISLLLVRVNSAGDIK